MEGSGGELREGGREGGGGGGGGEGNSVLEVALEVASVMYGSWEYSVHCDYTEQGCSVCVCYSKLKSCYNIESESERDPPHPPACPQPPDLPSP